MESEDGHVFIKNLAQFIHTHEQALANALQSRHKKTHTATSSTSSLSEVFTKPFAGLTGSSVKPSKLCLTPHHLYYLLTKFEELGVNVGTLNVRLENIHADTPGNYVSFLGQAPRRAGRGAADTDSLRSVSSVRSVLSNVSSIWSNFRSASREEKRGTQLRDDTKYLYSCFTKIPALKLAPDHRTRLIAGFEEFPFDTAVPVFVFKNLAALEVCDLDFRQVYGWDTLSKQLRSLIVRHAQLEDLLDVLVDIVLDDIDRRRRRSSRAPVPTTPSTPGGSWITSPRLKHADLAYSSSGPSTPFIKQRSGSLTELPARQRSLSPHTRPGSGSIAVVNHNLNEHRRSSSQGSGIRRTSSRQKSIEQIGVNILPSSTWQFLRHLSVAENGLHHISAASLAPVANTLQSLDLSGNLFTEVPDALATLSQLHALNLSNCMIESLRSLTRSPLPAITALNLHGNRISQLAGIDKLYSLERLDIRDNRLHDPAELARLTGIPYMSHIYIAKNPFTKTHPECRITIFDLFRKAPGRTDDIIIDQSGPMYNEKRRLIDWAPEPPMIAVVKPATDDEEIKENIAVQVTTPIKSTVDIAVAPLEVDSPARRKKSSRTRVVQLTDDQLSRRASTRSVVSLPDDRSVKSNGTFQHPASSVRQEGDTEQNTYTQKITNLKTELGNDWLNHVSADHEDTTLTSRPAHAAREISIGSRTLG